MNEDIKSKDMGAGRHKRLLLFTLSILMISGSLSAVIFMVKHREKPKQRILETKPPVVLVGVFTNGATSPRVNTRGTARAKWTTLLKAQVSGKIEYVNDRLQPGERFEPGAELARIEALDFIAAEANAEANLAQAQFELEEETRRSLQALTDWKRSGATNDPPAFTIREPHMVRTKAKVKAAQATLQLAQENVKRTHVTCPMDALIIKRHVSPGDFVGAGGVIAAISGVNELEVRLPLSPTQWHLLRPTRAVNGNALSILLRDQTGTASWTARLERTEGTVDASTRNLYIVATIDRAYDQDPPLRIGAFVSAELTGLPLSNTISLPASALDRGRYLWTVDEKNRLRRFEVVVRHQESEIVIIEAGKQTSLRVAIAPDSGFREGLIVRPRNAD